MTQRNAILCASDANCEDFLVDHWLASLLANVVLENIDIVVIDYGLSNKRRAQLDSLGVRRFIAIKDRHPCVARFRDMATALAGYDQVLCVDAGDIIFQSDVSFLFDQDRDTFRAACEKNAVPLHDFLISRQDFHPEQYQRIAQFLGRKPVINAGVLLGPAKKVCELWQQFQPHCRKLDRYGTDQLLLNYILYRDGFRHLDDKYNFVIISNKEPFEIRQGVFYDAQGEIIPLVHNAGKHDALRTIRWFGYGPDRNIRRRIVPPVLQHGFAVMKWWHKRSQRTNPQQPV